MSETSLSSFCNLYKLKCLVQELACNKNLERPILDCKNHFLKTEILKTGLSDFHKLIITVTTLIFEKQRLQIVAYRNCENYSNCLKRGFK